jgi:predicted esterase
MRLLLLSFLAALATLAVAVRRGAYSSEEIASEYHDRGSLLNGFVLLNGFYVCLADDSETLIMKRWVIHHEEAEPVLEQHTAGRYKQSFLRGAQVGFLWLSGVDEDG